MHNVQVLCAFFSVCSAIVSCATLKNPRKAFEQFFGVRLSHVSDPNSDAALTSALWASACCGEGVLQGCAAIWPHQFLRSLICFMVVYKGATIYAMMKLVQRTRKHAGSRPATEFYRISVAWAAPLLMFAAIWFSGDEIPW